MQADLDMLLNGAMWRAALYGRLQHFVHQNKGKTAENMALVPNPTTRFKNWAIPFCFVGDVMKNTTMRAFYYESSY